MEIIRVDYLVIKKDLETLLTIGAQNSFVKELQKKCKILLKELKKVNSKRDLENFALLNKDNLRNNPKYMKLILKGHVVHEGLYSLNDDKEIELEDPVIGQTKFILE